MNIINTILIALLFSSYISTSYGNYNVLGLSDYNNILQFTPDKMHCTDYSSNSSICNVTMGIINKIECRIVGIDDMDYTALWKCVAYNDKNHRLNTIIYRPTIKCVDYSTKSCDIYFKLSNSEFIDMVIPLVALIVLIGGLSIKYLY
jgi:hypothetical protein